MAKKLKQVQEVRTERPARAKLTPEESVRRMQEFPKRREKFIAAIRKSFEIH
jgi:hypothetical protein